MVPSTEAELSVNIWTPRKGWWGLMTDPPCAPWTRLGRSILQWGNSYSRCLWPEPECQYMRRILVMKRIKKRTLGDCYPMMQREWMPIHQAPTQHKGGPPLRKGPHHCLTNLVSEWPGSASICCSKLSFCMIAYATEGIWNHPACLYKPLLYCCLFGLTHDSHMMRKCFSDRWTADNFGQSKWKEPTWGRHFPFTFLSTFPSCPICPNHLNAHKNPLRHTQYCSSLGTVLLSKPLAKSERHKSPLTKEWLESLRSQPYSDLSTSSTPMKRIVWQRRRTAFSGFILMPRATKWIVTNLVWSVGPCSVDVAII